MDPNYVDEEEEAAAMAAMMGFSGFGSQKPPAKKRKFTTDAFVEGQDVKTLDKGGKKGQGSGGNTMPLGKARVFGFASSIKSAEPLATNDAEIDLSDEDETDGPQYVDTSRPPPIIAGDEEVLQYVGMIEAPPAAVPDEDVQEIQSRIDVSRIPYWRLIKYLIKVYIGYSRVRRIKRICTTACTRYRTTSWPPRKTLLPSPNYSERVRLHARRSKTRFWRG